MNLEDIWGTIFEYNKEAHKGLYEYYKKHNERDPDFEIYASLIDIFNETIEGGFKGYSFVSEGLTY